MKKYTVYKITHKDSGKYYIGVHYTDNPMDSYMGSGLAIKNAIRKYGKKSFKKEIIEIFDCKKKAYELEYKLTESFDKNITYNMKRGGVGGFSIESQTKGLNLLNENRLENSKKGGKVSYANNTGIHSLGGDVKKANSSKGGKANKGLKKSLETRRKISESLKRRNKLKIAAGSSTVVAGHS